MKVLVVDDSQALRQRLAAMLAEVQHVEAVVQAANGIEALDAVRLVQPDVVVLDLQMPRMNGFQLLEGLREHSAAITTIVVTNHAHYRPHALGFGARYFFDKGTELDALVATVADLAAVCA